MDFEVIFWTAVFFGGDLLALAFLIAWAVKKDREKARVAERSPAGTA
jgi:hypothetical protein